jgi:hypothetical protein
MMPEYTDEVTGAACAGIVIATTERILAASLAQLTTLAAGPRTPRTTLNLRRLMGTSGRGGLESQFMTLGLSAAIEAGWRIEVEAFGPYDSENEEPWDIAHGRQPALAAEIRRVVIGATGAAGDVILALYLRDLLDPAAFAAAVAPYEAAFGRLPARAN